MSVTMRGRVGFSSLGGEGIAYFDMGRYDTATNTNKPKETQPKDTNAAMEHVPWGDDNKLPSKMVADIENCGVLTGGIDGKARFGLSRGIMPFTLDSVKGLQENLSPVDDSEILEWMEDTALFEDCFGWFKDMIGLGQNLGRLKFTKDGKKVGFLTRHDVAEMRLQKKEEGVIKNVLLSAQWDTGTSKPEDLIRIPLLPNLGQFHYLDMMKPEERKNKEFAILSRQPGWNRHYYSLPLWYSARKWVEIAKGVPEMKAAIFENNIRLKYIVTIHETYWDRAFPGFSDLDAENQEQKRNELYDEIEKFLVGSKNSYKSLFVDGRIDTVLEERFSDIEIKPVEDNTKPGELLPDSAAANSEILFALMMNPALMGADTPGGPYSGGAGSGSNIREAAWVQVMIQEFERNSITRMLNLVGRINGWKKRIPKLVWRSPGLVLTTLDTGGSTEEVATGT